MFSSLKKILAMNRGSEVDEIYLLLNKALLEEGVGEKSAEQLFDRNDLIEFLSFGKNAVTTAEMALLWRQSVFAERMLENASLEDIAKDFIELENQKDKTAEDFIEEECEGCIDSAKAYGERIAILLDNGVMTDNQQVREFCANHATSMLASWQRYRLKLQKSLMDIRNKN